MLDQHRLDRRSASQRLGVSGQDAPDLRLIKHPRGVIDNVMALDQRFIELPDRVIVEKRAAAFVLPSARHGRNAQRRMHLRRAVAAASEAVAQTEKRALGLADQTGKSLDLLYRHA